MLPGTIQYPIMSNYFIQVYASVKRIGGYLEEDEVPEWVSWKSESRLGSVGPAGAFDERVGFSKASFIWSFQKKDESDVKKDAVETDTPAEAEPQPFGLRDLDIFFQLGRINLISGPTGSGKSSCKCRISGCCINFCLTHVGDAYSAVCSPRRNELHRRDGPPTEELSAGRP